MKTMEYRFYYMYSTFKSNQLVFEHKVAKLMFAMSRLEKKAECL